MRDVVSVPSRGILFPNSVRKIQWKMQKRFPSPLGVSYFQMHITEKQMEELADRFPSPLGVSYFQIIM